MLAIKKANVLNCTQFSKRAQNIMSSTASNYDLGRLNAGIVLAALATVACLATAFTTFLAPRSSGLWTSSVSVLYGLMMFASSYVEEEQHFWYWASSGWIAWLFLKQ